MSVFFGHAVTPTGKPAAQPTFTCGQYLDWRFQIITGGIAFMPQAVFERRISDVVLSHKSPNTELLSMYVIYRPITRLSTLFLRFSQNSAK